jgi:DNA-directed RNA polymerase alpha subunit
VSGTAIAHYLLRSDAGLTAVVPAARIKNGIVPVGATLPAISISKVSAVQRNTLAMNEISYLVTERVQITVESQLNITPVDILALIRAALPHTTSNVNGFACVAIVPEGEGPRLEDLTNLTVSESVDYKISYTRT